MTIDFSNFSNHVKIANLQKLSLMNNDKISKIIKSD